MYTIVLFIIGLASLYCCVSMSFKRIIGSLPNTPLNAEELEKFKIEEINFITSPYKCGIFCFKQKCEVYSFSTKDGKCTTYNSTLKIPMPTDDLHVFIMTGNGSCNEGWSQFGKKCFLLIATPLQWGDAQIQCRKYGGTLAHASDKGVNEFLKGMARKHGSSVWIGGFKSQGIWKWDGNNENVTFHGWSPDNPSGVGDCFMLWDSRDWAWDDHYCDVKVACLCELPSSYN